jgi:hypothetical protein
MQGLYSVSGKNIDNIFMNELLKWQNFSVKYIHKKRKIHGILSSNNTICFKGFFQSIKLTLRYVFQITSSRMWLVDGILLDC